MHTTCVSPYSSIPSAAVSLHAVQASFITVTADKLRVLSRFRVVSSTRALCFLCVFTAVALGQRNHRAFQINALLVLHVCCIRILIHVVISGLLSKFDCWTTETVWLGDFLFFPLMIRLRGRTGGDHRAKGVVHVCIKWKPTSLLLVTLSDALLAVCNYNLILGWGFCVWSVRINKRPLKKLEHQYGRGAVWKKAVCWGYTFAAVINTTQSRIYFQTAGDPHWSWILRDVCTDPPPLQKRLHCLHLSKTAWKDLVCQSAWLFFFSLWKLQLCSTCLTISGSRLGAGKHDFRKFHFQFIFSIGPNNLLLGKKKKIILFLFFPTHLIFTQQ